MLKHSSMLKIPNYAKLEINTCLNLKLEEHVHMLKTIVSCGRVQDAGAGVETQH